MKHLIPLLVVLMLAVSVHLKASIEFPVKDVQLLLWNSDGTRLAACAGNTLMILNPADGSIATIPVSHKAAITAVSWCGIKDACIATGDADGTVIFYNTALKKAVSWTQSQSRVLAIGGSHTDNTVAVAYSKSGVRVYSVLDGKASELALFMPAVDTLASLEYTSPVLTIRAGRSIVQHNLSTGISETVFSAPSQITAHSGSVYGLEDGTAIIAHNAKPVVLNPGIHEPIISINTHSNSSVIGIASAHSITFWDAETGVLRDSYSFPTGFQTTQLRPNSAQSAVSTGYKVILYDLSHATDVQDGSTSLYEIQPFPNPSTDLLRVNVRLPHPETIHLALVDGFGRECAILFNGVQHTDQSIYTADTRLLPAGGYYMVLTTPQQQTAIPIVILH